MASCVCRGKSEHEQNTEIAYGKKSIVLEIYTKVKGEDISSIQYIVEREEKVKKNVLEKRIFMAGSKQDLGDKGK